MSFEYLEHELPWYQYYPLLAVALELHEQEQYWDYALSLKTDAKKWRWRFRDNGYDSGHDGRPWDKIKRKVAPHVQHRTRIDKIAQADWPRLKKIVETFGDGTQRVTYRDEAGNDVTEQVVERMKTGKEIFMGVKVKGD